MVAEGQVPPDELAPYTLEEVGNRILAILRLSQHAFDGVGSETTTGNVDRHGISPEKAPTLKAPTLNGRWILPPQPSRVQESGSRFAQRSRGLKRTSSSVPN